MSAVIQKTKGWFLGAGIIMIVLGMLAISVPLVAAIAIEVLFGWLFVIGGLVTCVHSFRALNSGKCILRLLSGILSLAIGIIFLGYPMKGLLTITLLLAILFLFEGIIKIAVAVQLKSTPNWGWMLSSGIAAVILAALVFSGYPGSATWVLGLIVGINLIFSGWTMVMLSTVQG